MKRNEIIALLGVILPLLLFLVSWLVFKSITLTDWLFLALSAASLVLFLFMRTKGDR